ncbi:MAG: hypothetical protein ACXVAA_11910, partial [Candidatus Binataceae bacterium]
ASGRAAFSAAGLVVEAESVDNGAGGAMRRPPRGFLFPIARESLSSMRLFFSVILSEGLPESKISRRPPRVILLSSRLLQCQGANHAVPGKRH